jgi:soluble lytic murein transglycosylase-like protein
VYRLLVSLLGATAGALAVVADPQSADGLRLPQPGIAKSSLVCPVPIGLRPAFVAAAHSASVQLSLLAAVAQVESRFDQGARSNVGAVGVLQLLPSTAAELKLDPLRSRTNVLAGALYLKQMLDRYRSPALALAAYNAGPAAVDRVAGPASFETAAYVANVQVWWRAYEGCT